MFLRKVCNTINTALLLMIVYSSNVLAATSTQETGDPLEVSNAFSEKVLEIVKGPILKVLAAAVLLVGIAGLLRGRHKLAVSCGLAFLLLLFLPILLGRV